MQMVLKATLFAGLCASLLTSHAQQLTIDSPSNDTITLANSLTIAGSASGGAPTAKPKIQLGNSTPFEADLNSGKWKVLLNNVPKGPSKISVSYAGKSAAIIVNRGVGIVGRPRQKVRFSWQEGVDEILRDIARGTLEESLSAAQLDAFVINVKARTESALLVAYADFDIELTEVDGNDVHTIAMLKDSGSIYGQSPYDFGNGLAKQRSEVWVGTYHASMVNSFKEWEPMKKEDSLNARIIDVAEALGRTSAHELGHSLGLVGSGIPSGSGWMMGCDSGHSCDRVDIDMAPADRFDQGFYIMDPGGKTFNNARIAEASAMGRTAPRQAAVFCNFDRAYLRILHPKQ